MKLIWIWFSVALLGLTISLFGADCAFSSDSEHLDLIQYQQTPPRKSGEYSLIDVNLEKQTANGIDLRKVLGGPLRDITLSKSGFILCATKSALWAYDPTTGHCVKVIDAPKGLELDQIAYDSSQEIVLAACGEDDQQLFCLPKNKGHWVPVYDRRSASVEFPVFARDGQLFFSSHGDLWTGSLEAQTEPTIPAWNAYPGLHGASGKWPQPMELANLSACRCAPLAFLETANTTSDSTGLYDVAITPHFVYGGYSRLNGSVDWGSLLRCKRPDTTIPDGSSANGKQAIPLLQTFETISDKVCLYLCASPDGSLVFYVTQGSGEFLIKNEGKPKPLTITGLDDLL
jgi:hypothetical protein